MGGICHGLLRKCCPGGRCWSRQDCSHQHLGTAANKEGCFSKRGPFKGAKNACVLFVRTFL